MYCNIALFLLLHPITANNACLTPGGTVSSRTPALFEPHARHCLSALRPRACYEAKVSLPAWAPLGVRVMLLDGAGRNVSYVEGEEKLQFCVGATPPAAVALAFPLRGPAPLTGAEAAPYHVRLDELYWGVLPTVALRMSLPLALALAGTAAACGAAARSGGRGGGARRRPG